MYSRSNNVEKTERAKTGERKQVSGCFVIFIALLMIMIYSVVWVLDFVGSLNFEWKKFSNKRIKEVEAYMHLDIPDDVEMTVFRKSTGLGDGDNGYFRLWLTDVEDPEDFLAEVFKNSDCKEILPDNGKYREVLGDFEDDYMGYTTENKAGAYDLIFGPEKLYVCRRDDGDNYLVGFKEENGSYSAKIVFFRGELGCRYNSSEIDISDDDTSEKG